MCILDNVRSKEIIPKALKTIPRSAYTYITWFEEVESANLWQAELRQGCISFLIEFLENFPHFSNTGCPID